MKCEIIRDLLPLYVDGLTSDASTKEIEKHLKSCKECRIYYQEMTGKIPNAVSLSDEELQEIDLIKKMKRTNRKRVLRFLAGGFLTASIFFILTFSWINSPLKYKEAKIDYGVRGDQIYCTIDTKPWYKIYLTGESTDKTLNVKIQSIKIIGGFQNNHIGWEDKIGSEDDPCRWTIEFRDKIIVIENGKLVEEREYEP